MKPETLQKYKAIYVYFHDNPDESKAAIARRFNTSSRSVGRAIEYIESTGSVDLPDGSVASEPATPRYTEGYPQYVVSSMAVVIMFDPNAEPVIVDKSHANFNAVIEAARDGDWEQVERYSELTKAIEHFSNGNITYKDGTLYYCNYPMDNSLTRYIIDHFSRGEEPTVFINFFDNIMENPDPRAVDELFDFIRECDLPITRSGHFVAYKKVRDDYTDVHSGTFDNSVGSICKMPRSMVDTNKHNTCSRGLHFCSKSYLNSFGGNRIMAVKINPSDVVSIPADYNNAKGRAWKYEVIAELRPGEDLPSYFIDDEDGINDDGSIVEEIAA